MAFLSDLIISHPEVTSYGELEALVVAAARSGMILLYMDLKPDFPDTPRDWQHRLELLFHRGEIPASLKR
jgi:hypothetical protein